MEEAICTHPDIAECAVIGAPDELKGQVRHRSLLSSLHLLGLCVNWVGSVILVNESFCGVCDADRIASSGQVPVGLLVLKAGTKRAAADITADVVNAVRGDIGPIACFRTALIVQRLPKTRSGKILRGTMRKIAANEKYAVPATIEDPAVLQEIADALTAAGYGRNAYQEKP